jgi:voltage-gated potassium channel
VAPIARVRLAGFGLLLLVALGTAGYHFIEGWNLFDSVYMTVITLSGVGFREVRDLSVAGRLFTIALIAVGIITAAVLISGLVETVLAAELGDTRRRRRMEKRLATLREHTILCGYGRMGQEIAREFDARKMPYVVVEIDPEPAKHLAAAEIPHVVGDATHDASLQAAGIDRARSLIAVAHTDADNIFIVLSARTLNPRLQIVARSIALEDEHKLRRAGADRVISPYVIGARSIAAAVLRPDVVDFLDLYAQRSAGEMEAVTITAVAPFRDRTLAEARIREHTGCMVIAIRPRERAGTARRFLSNPPPGTPLREGDVLIAFGTPDQLAALEKLAGGDQ